MSVLETCREYYHRRCREYGHPPKQIRMYKCELDMLKDEVKWEMMHPCETPSPDTVFGMEIIIVGEGY